MNKRPVSYLQTDARWKSKPYRVQGESSTIGDSGCGPTAAAMLIETITGKAYTPEDACKWSVEHGYKAKNQGTYYAYFKPQFAAFGIECDMLNWVNTYGKPDHANHKKAFDLLKQGYYLIALMNKGLWTGSGHFIVVWWEDGKVRINDPASTKEARVNGDPQTFKSQVKYYWWVDARQHNAGNTPADNGKDDFDMDIKEARTKLTTCANTGDTPSEWAKEATDYCKKKGIFCGDGNGNYGWQQPITREATAQIIYNLLENIGMVDKLPDAD